MQRPTFANTMFAVMTGCFFGAVLGLALGAFMWFIFVCLAGTVGAGVLLLTAVMFFE